MKSDHRQVHTQQGFTLIEMLVAVFIFTVSLTSLMLISSQGLKSTRNAQKRVTAEFLAVEGLEVVRNIRDKAFLFGYDTSTWQGVFKADNILGSSGCFDNGNPCEFEYDAADGTFYLSVCADDCNIYLHDDYFDYTAAGGVDTGYDRALFLNVVTGTGGKEIEVVSQVSFDDSVVTYTSNLFLWQ